MKLPWKGLLLALLTSCASTNAPPPVVDAGPRPNVLLICIDDLRPELGCYGADHITSPNLDAFAASGMRFDRQYVQFPTCGASRYSFLTGQRPSQPAHYGNGAFDSLDADFNPAHSLPGAFRAAGYHTVCLGKVSHSHDGKTPRGTQELPGAWDETPTDSGAWKEAHYLLHGYADGETRTLGKSPISEFLPVEDNQYPDGLLAEQAIAQMRGLAARSEPFFLAVGFFKPHLPLAAPRKYWDMYGGDLPESEAPDMPSKLPRVHGWTQSGEVTQNYIGVDYANAEWSASERAHLRRAYFACVSYVDAQVGKVLDELQSLGLADNTIVVVWGDHGWHLGEQALFGKHTTFEAALRSPLLVRAPGVTRPPSSTRALVEALDVFPTLADLCRVPTPDGLPGQSFTHVLADGEKPHREVALSYWQRGNWLATSLRTNRYRLVGWSEPIHGRIGGLELYDLEPMTGAPGAVYERENIAVSRGAVVDALVKKYLSR